MRLKKVLGLMESRNLDAVLITQDANVFYFTSLPRPAGTYLFIIRGWQPKLLTPALDYWRVSDAVKGVEVIPYARYELPAIETKPVTVRPSEWVVTQLRSVNARRVGLDTGAATLVASEVAKGLGSDVEIIDVEKDIIEMRAVKEPSEISAIREALRISEDAFRKTLNELKPGMKEYEVAALLEGTMRFLGADGYAFETIVASGSNAAYPHAVPSTRQLGDGEAVVMDFGARFGGYCSDMTRTPVIGQPDEELRNALEAVKEAVDEAMDAVAPGVRVSDVDAVARKVLERHGLSKYFIHALGHGVGIEVHEPPRLAQGVDEELKPGMIVTIEPGVYVHGKYGVRIENMVLVTASGREVLNKVPELV